MTADHARRPAAGDTTRRCEPPPYRGRCTLRSGLR